ncbi:MAG TPA: hypothetical protein VFB08_05285 [Burkholderiales bacterium]|nr:hypothetical protein [Burkholderiales bacterium]
MEYSNPTSNTALPADTGAVRDNVRDLQSRAQETLQQAGRRWNDTVQAVSSRARDAARYTEQQMQENPWTALGIGFGAGMIMGALLVLAANPRR